jgi:hypothetical protein
MSHPGSSSPAAAAPSGLRPWLRRILLLSGASVSLAMAWEPTAGMATHVTSGHVLAGADAGGSRLLLALSTIMHATSGWPDSHVESVSLLALGAGLIVVSRALGRKRPATPVTSDAAAAGETAAEILEQQRSRVSPFVRRAAR